MKAIAKRSRNDLASMAVVQDLDTAFEQYLGALNDATLTPISRMVLAGQAIGELRQLLTRQDVLPILRSLAGSPLGFRMDKDSYPDKIIVDACTEAVLRGLPPFGNRFNIIAGRFYCTKEGFQLLVGQLAKYAMEVRVAPISAALRASGGHVRCTVKGSYQRIDNGSERQNLTMTYNVRVTRNNKVAEENAEGKAERKYLRDVYARLTGQELEGGDVSDDIVEQASDAPQTLTPEHFESDRRLQEVLYLVEKMRTLGILDGFVDEVGAPPDEWLGTEIEDKAAQAIAQAERR